MTGRLITHDLRAALRAAARRPAFTLGVGSVLVTAVAATAAAFSVTTGTRDAARWWADESRTVQVWPDFHFSRGQLDWLREHTGSFQAVGGIMRRPAVVALGDRATTTVEAALSPELFQALRAAPLLGRGLTPQDAAPGGEPIVVLGHGLWSTAFGADAGVLGSVVEVSGVRRRVVGVMPPGAEQPGPGTELWTPLVLDPAHPDFWPARELEVAAVTLPGVSLAEAQRDVRAALAAHARRFPFFYRPDFGADATVVRSSERVWGSVATPLLLLLGGTALLLLVGAIDVGNLVLARSLGREGELRIRAAVGATRRQIVQQILVEAGVVAGAAGAAGWALGAALAGRIPELFPHGTPVEAAPPLGGPVVLFVLATTVLSWSLMGGIPTAHFLAITRRSLGARPKRGGAPRGLVVAQAALSTVLLVTAALLLRTVRSFEGIPLGFEPAGVAVVPVSPAAAPLAPIELDRLRDDVVERLTAAPGVPAAGWISAVPLLDAMVTAPVNAEDDPREVAAAPTATSFVVDAGALAALGAKVVAGRGFAPEDHASAPRVALVNETLARTLWPDRQPVGRRIAVDPHDWTRWITVVGVVEDLRFRDLALPVQPAFFLPRSQAFAPAMTVVARSPAGPAATASAVRQVLAERAPDVPAGEGRDMAGIVRDAYGTARVLTALLVGLAALATLLGALGLYGTLTAWVARRRLELGTRLALGASPRRLFADVLAGGVLLTAGGVAIGVLGAALSANAIRSLLYGVSTLDPLAFTVPGALLLVAGAVAAAIPAIRAGAVPPAEALRSG